MPLRVGITGKRDLTRQQLDGLRPRVAQVLSEIKATCGKQPPGATLRAISPLAEGADRLFAEEALNLGFELQSPLPYQPEEYKRDFKDHASRAAFDRLLSKATAIFEVEGETDPAHEHLPAAYETVGRIVVDHCDLLIAIWDGLPAQGKGGTAHVMETARHRAIPVVCLGTGDFPDTFYGRNPGDAGVRLKTELYTEAVAAIVKPHDLPSYLETAGAKPSLLGMLWSAFFNLMRAGARLPHAWPENLPAGELKLHYQRFDAIASRLTGLYRGAFLLNYKLGLSAVFFALLGFAYDPWEHGWLWCEFSVIVALAVLMVLLATKRWHFHSVDCRYLAEQFRILCYIYPLGLTAPRLRLPAHQPHGEVQKSWMEGLLRAFLRAQPLPSGQWTKTEAQRYYQEVLEDLIQSQLVYHARNSLSLETAEKRLDLLGWFFVSMAALACLLHFHFGPPVAPWLTLCAAGFPAAAAACHAIGSQGEFRRLARRSEAMHESLKTVREGLEHLNRSGQLTPAALRRECEALAALMIEEVVDWQILYRKPVPPG
jgi:hypothetical protein